ncbi:MAG: hypothetical protein HYU36_15705 [Planctomycetes bacterium]|nr:hypothetical protein [Planctomycetota bacterium]
MQLDIAPFAHREESPSEASILFRWEEPREIHRILLEFPSDSIPRENLHIRYWKRFWPEHRVLPSDFQPGALCRAGWKPRDDWFNGTWVTADTRLERAGRQVAVTFAPVCEKEFPALAGCDLKFRQTLQLQILAPGAQSFSPAVQVFTDSALEEQHVAVELGCGRTPVPWDGKVEVYNGVLEAALPPTADDPRLRLRLLCARPAPFSFDHTLVTVRSTAASFTFRPDELAGARVIWSPDLGVLVAPEEAGLRYGPELPAQLLTGRTVYDRIPEMPEQSLARAMRGQPPKKPMHFVVGCEGRRQKFGIEPNGDLFAREGFVRRVAGPDTPKVLWKGRDLRLRFFWDTMTPNGRFVDGGCLPILASTYSRGDLDITQAVLATLPGGIDQPIRGEDTVVAFVRLRFLNRGPNPLPVRQRFQFFSGDPSRPETLSLEGMVVRAAGEPASIRLLVDAPDGGRLSLEPSGQELTYEAELPPGVCRKLLLRMPFVSVLSPAELSSLRALDFDLERAAVRRYWEKRLASGSSLRTSEPDVDDFHRSHLTHILINDDHECGSSRVMGRVSSFNYGNFSNEAIMQVVDLDRRGHHEEARRHLDTYLHYQGTVALPGNFKGKEGLFYGSGGYEHGDYNQHHGWVLWGLAEHYRLSGDRDWLTQAADRIVAGCDWVVRERRATQRVDNRGRRVLEYGFLPAGSLEDVRDFYYWLSTNALTSWGLTAAAEALADAGHPEGPRLVQEARSYLADLRAGFLESRIRSPLVRLRDGSSVPYTPSRLHWRGRDVGWIREVLEGAIILTTTVLEPSSQESTWILKDYEDNRYLDSPYNYALDHFEGQWFDRGGFSFQPNLLYFPPPYLLRDQVEHFLRAFFNGFAACWRPELRAMTEHPSPTLADWAGDHFKSSDEAMVSFWLRSMFIQEVGNDLYLGRGLPRAWLASGETLFLKNAATHFGRMSFEIEARPGGNSIRARIDPPTRRPPARIFVRFRHPQKLALRRVTVGGRPWPDIDPAREWVILPPLTAPAELEARYDS